MGGGEYIDFTCLADSCIDVKKLLSNSRLKIEGDAWCERDYSQISCVSIGNELIINSNARRYINNSNPTRTRSA